MPGMGQVTFSLHNVLTRWVWSPFTLFVLAVVVTLAVWYLRADWTLATKGRRWPARRTVPFLLGLLTIDLAFQSSIANLAGTYFEAHVIQHLLLMVVAPLLLALGAPSTLLLQTAGRRTKRRWLAFLHSKPFAVLSHPLVAWCLYFGVMYLFFLTPLINVSMHHQALMDAMNVLFLLGGTLYWWPLIGLDPIVRWKMGYGPRMLNVLLGTGVEAFLGTAILMANHPEASMYSLSSTHAGGGVLWASTEIVTLVAFVPIFLQWMHSEERAAGRLDRAAMRRTSEPADGTLVPAAAGESDSSVEPGAAQVPLTPWEAEWLARTGTIPRRG